MVLRSGKGLGVEANRSDFSAAMLSTREDILTSGSHAASRKMYSFGMACEVRRRGGGDALVCRGWVVCLSFFGLLFMCWDRLFDEDNDVRNCVRIL